MNGLFIINPVSGSKSVHQQVPAVLDILLERTDCKGIHVFYTHKKGDAEETAGNLRKGQYDFVCAVGGDGTISEVAAGLYRSRSGIPMAVMAAGTSNDFSTSLSMPKTAKEIADMILEGNIARTDLGRINGKYFYSEVGGGGLAEVAHSTPADKKTRFGYLAYLSGGLKKYGNLKLDTVPLIYEIDGIEEEFDTFCFSLTNAKRAGGFSTIAPLAKIDDGRMDLCIIKKVARMEVLPAIMQINAGEHANNNKWIEYRQLKTLKVRTKNESDAFVLDIDGEDGGNLPLDFEIVPAAVDLIVPPDPAHYEPVLSGPPSIADYAANRRE